MAAPVWSFFVQYPNREPVLRELVVPPRLGELRSVLEVFDDQHLLVADLQKQQFTAVERIDQLHDGASLRVTVPRRRIYVSRRDDTVRNRPVVWYPGAGADQIESAIVKACRFPAGTTIELLDGDVAVVISATIPNESSLVAVPLASTMGSVGPKGANDNGHRWDRPAESPRRAGLRDGVRTATTPPVPRATGVRSPVQRGNAGASARAGTPQHGGATPCVRPPASNRGGSPSRGPGGSSVSTSTAAEPVERSVEPRGRISVQDEHCVHILAGHAGFVLSLCTVGDVLFTGSQDCNIMIWDLNNLQYIGTLPGHTGFVKCMAATLPRKMLCSGSQDKTIKVWSLETFSAMKTFTGHTSEVSTLEILPEQDLLLSGGEDRTLRIWDLKAMSLLTQLDQAHLSGIFVLGQLDAENFLTAGRDHSIKVWSSSTWQASRTLSPPHYDGVCDVAIGHRLGRFYSASRDRSIRRWDAQTLESDTLIPQAHGDWVTSLSLSPSEGVLFSGGRDSVVKVWDAELNCKDILTGHHGPISSLAAVENHLFSASHDRTVRVWRVDHFEQS